MSSGERGEFTDNVLHVDLVQREWFRDSVEVEKRTRKSSSSRLSVPDEGHNSPGLYTWSS